DRSGGEGARPLRRLVGAETRDGTNPSPHDPAALGPGRPEPGPAPVVRRRLGRPTPRARLRQDHAREPRRYQPRARPPRPDGARGGERPPRQRSGTPGPGRPRGAGARLAPACRPPHGDAAGTRLRELAADARALTGGGSTAPGGCRSFVLD